MLKFAILALLALASNAHYEDSDVLVLDDSSFKTEILADGVKAIVVFYAPWCGHCKRLVPDFRAAATTAKGTATKFGSVDCTVHQELCSTYGVRGYPTIKLFENAVASDYKGGRSADALAAAFN